MKRFGLIGCPISHSLSPALFRAAYGKKYGSSYVYDLIEGDDFMMSFGTFMKYYDGINVTAPFKEKAFAMADTAEKGCQAIGAANLLVKTVSGITAYNTDCMGVALSLERAGVQAQAGMPGHRSDELTALVVGCGGAGKAAAAAATAMGMKTTILNRTVSKAEEFASGFPGRPFNVGSLDCLQELFRSSDVVIYTLPDAVPVLSRLGADDFPETGVTILEANYRNPCFPKILSGIFPEVGNFMPDYTGEQCRKAPSRDDGRPVPTYVPGQQWLLYQAVAGYRTFTGEAPDEKAMMKVL